jgi:hypothetical protein
MSTMDLFGHVATHLVEIDQLKLGRSLGCHGLASHVVASSRIDGLWMDMVDLKTSKNHSLKTTEEQIP